jgi:hypothetical protein
LFVGVVRESEIMIWIDMVYTSAIVVGESLLGTTKFSELDVVDVQKV